VFQNSYGRLEQDNNAVKEIEVPDPGDQLDVEGAGEHGHEPLVQVLPWLNFF